ncbi:MAG TPA: ATP-dependent DNA helicase [Clostridiales bacterium]|nr:ATP-dependent DNA helicase [Clostridiales bacterium]
MDKYQVRISVRNMVEFLLQSGDINQALGCSKALQQGTLIHRRLQAEAGSDYRSEVRLSYEVDFDDFIILIEGIADGIITGGELPLIDEIKSTSAPLDIIDENYSTVHWAQAKCYGWMYLYQTGAPMVTVRLTYCHSESNEVKRFSKSFSYDELKEFFFNLVEQYAVWIRMKIQHINDRNKSILCMPFPFPQYRLGQRRLAAEVYYSIRDGRSLFAQAPTGTGKTISVLFPSIKAMGQGMGEKIFYLTAKTLTRQAAEHAISIMSEKGLILRSITLTAKDKACFMDTTVCNPADCSYACGHYDRVNNAVFDILQRERIITREILLDYARKHHICPFEYSLDISLWTDCIICDYNHVFDPRVYLRRFFDPGGDYILLIDEAHNLAERARKMYSADLSKQSLMKYRKEWKQSAPDVYREFSAVNRWFINARKMFDKSYDAKVIDFPSELIVHVEKFTGALEKFVMESPLSIRNELLELFFACRAFLMSASFFDERFICYVIREGSDIRLRLLCADPSYLLQKACGKGRSAVFFSGTLQPLEFYKSILGGRAEDRTLCLTSPFPSENLCLMIAGNISTRYRNREDSYEKIAEYIKAAIEAKNGNYMVFFPSYEYMMNVYSIYVSSWPGDYTIVQHTDMNDVEREGFLDFFEDTPEKTMIAFVVMGGIFSEGIDLIGERLSGAVIVGVGLPQLSLERNLISQYYQSANGQGFEYAYMLPGLNRVMQAAGRVIRTSTDRGFVLLIDDRFLHRRYLDQYPAEWQHYHRVYNSRDVSCILHDFWNNAG